MPDWEGGEKSECEISGDRLEDEKWKEAAGRGPERNKKLKEEKWLFGHYMNTAKFSINGPRNSTT
jgi:hypothetical protein